MSDFIPTDEQLHDYFEHTLDHELRPQVKDYISRHPEIESVFSDFANIEKSFTENYKLESPSHNTLENIMQFAEKEAHKKKSFLDSIKSILAVKKISYALSLFVVIGLSYALKQLHNSTDNYSNFNQSSEIAAKPENGNNFLKANVNDNSKISTDSVLKTQNGNLETWSDQEFKKAIQQFNLGEHEKANSLFSLIIQKNPQFSKKKEVYNYWIESLNKLGKYDLAQQKKQILESLKN